ncbi:hypothetical protein FRC08_013723 [Ceratobasidium sp. 394]|nr:hypothetical protein FRC08_013723 [Ceratobasidium sp. 394]
MNIRFGDEVVDRHLKQSGCKLVVYSGKTEAWVRRRRELHGIEMVELPENEYARVLAQEERNNSDTPPEWPTPKRPSPALIIQSSSSCANPKLMSFSLHFYTIGLAWNCEQYLGSKPLRPGKGPRTHPRLVYKRPFWQAFHSLLIEHLVTATPVTFVATSELCRLSGQELVAWIETSDIGGLASSVHNVREIVTVDAHTELLQGLYSIVMIGSVVDERLSDMIAQKQLKAIAGKPQNRFGISELGRLLWANQAPYTHLCPFPNFPPPLAVPISNGAGCDSHPSKLPGREVQLWYLVDSCPQLAHVAFQGGVPLKLESFPGPGPAHGRLAMNLGDIFHEVHLREGTKDQVVYAHAGRFDDYLRLRGGDGQHINASWYEIEVRSLVDDGLRGSQWALDAVQMFGSNLPMAALVVQLLGEADLDEAVV